MSAALPAENLGETLIPAINKLQDIFSQVGQQSSFFPGPRTASQDGHSYTALVLRAPCEDPDHTAGYLGLQARPASSGSRGKPEQREIERA